MLVLNVFYFADVLGTIAFAFSGVIAASRRRMDIFGFIIIALLTANGGGTLRDILLGNYPVFWIQQIFYLILPAICGFLGFFLASYLATLKWTLRIFDGLGLAAFTILAIHKSLLLSVSPLIALIMGLLTATGGGMLRDIFCSRVPLVLRQEIYATAALMGGIVYLILLNYIQESIAAYIGFVLILMVRFSALYWGLSFSSIIKKLGDIKNI